LGLSIELRAAPRDPYFNEKKMAGKSEAAKSVSICLRMTAEDKAAIEAKARERKLTEHQHIVAIHANTDNLHAHIEVNRVHPKTFCAFDPYRDYLTLHRAAREVEIRYYWRHDNGAFNVVEINGKKHIVRNDGLRYDRQDSARCRS
jgi:hypothetical protein